MLQVRKTGEPYVTHCIETALIVEHNLPHWRQDSRCVLAVAWWHGTRHPVASAAAVASTAADNPALSCALPQA